MLIVLKPFPCWNYVVKWSSKWNQIYSSAINNDNIALNANAINYYMMLTHWWKIWKEGNRTWVCSHETMYLS
jgi:hypothetical protein